MSGRDSDIEQQLSNDDSLFERMAGGAVEEEVVVEEPTPVEEVLVEEEVIEDKQLEVEKDDPDKKQVVEVDDEVLEEEDDDPPPSLKVEKLYSPTEIQELLSEGDFSQIDTSRLSEEGKLVMKSMQSGLTPKLQEAAELRRQMAELTETVQKSLPKPQPKDIFEAYDQDPDGVTAYLNKNVQEAIATGDAVAVETAKEYRDQVRHYSATKPAEAAPASQTDNTAVQLLKAIPDIKDKDAELTKYAIDVMGYTQEELQTSTNLTRGEAAVREIVRINNAYEKYMAPRRAQKKAVKKRPTKVEKSGGGFEQNETTNKDRIAQAKKSGTAGDWMDVFLNMED